RDAEPATATAALRVPRLLTRWTSLECGGSPPHSRTPPSKPAVLAQLEPNCFRSRENRQVSDESEGKIPVESKGSFLPLAEAAMQIADFLANQQVEFEAVPHAPAFTAHKLAKYLRISGSQVAKAVLLYGSEGFLLAILPATHRIDLKQLEAE